jgi:exopolysaccharide production protein ExoQ
MRFTDPVVLFFWVIFTSVPNDSATLPRYACVAYFVMGMALFARQTLPTLVRGWPLLILPTMCLISTIWAPSLGEAVRKGVFMALSATIAVYAASRMSGRQIITFYFLGEIYGALLTLLAPNTVDGNWTGPFGQKNFLAVHMFILYATGFALTLDKGSNRWIRLAGAAFVVISALIIVMTKSATTLILMIGATGAFLGHAYLWGPAKRVPHLRTVIVMLLVLMTLVTTLILFGLFQFDAVDSLLKALGKDSTLTGRTFIWDWGYRIMNEHPWTGVGANGFWRPELGVANQITTFFYYEHFVKFSFHNSYIENGVQFGYPGYYATMFVAAWGLWSAGRSWVRNQTLINGAFLIISLMVIVRSNAEADLAAELAGTAILFYLGAVRKEKPGSEPPSSRRRPALPHAVRSYGP